MQEIFLNSNLERYPIHLGNISYTFKKFFASTVEKQKVYKDS